jgi:hypothetical protein
VRNGAVCDEYQDGSFAIRHFQFKDEGGSLTETMYHFSMLFNSAVSCCDKITLVTDK